MIDLSDETEVLVRRLAEAQRLTEEDVVRQALEARALEAGLPLVSGPTRDQPPEAAAGRRERLDQIVREIAALPVLDGRSPSDIMDDLNDR